MKKAILAALCISTFVLGALPALPAFGGDSLIRAGTPDAARVTARLKQARDHDLMQAQSYMGGENRDAGVFYYRKSKEIDAILNSLGRGDSVSRADVENALDNRAAVRYGTNF